jgi:hypothetical protein
MRALGRCGHPGEDGLADTSAARKLAGSVLGLPCGTSGWHSQNQSGLIHTGRSPSRRSRDYLQKFVASEIEKWAGPIKISGVRLD